MRPFLGGLPRFSGRATGSARRTCIKGEVPRTGLCVGAPAAHSLIATRLCARNGFADFPPLSVRASIGGLPRLSGCTTGSARRTCIKGGVPRTGEGAVCHEQAKRAECREWAKRAECREWANVIHQYRHGERGAFMWRTWQSSGIGSVFFADGYKALQCRGKYGVAIFGGRFVEVS